MNLNLFSLSTKGYVWMALLMSFFVFSPTAMAQSQAAKDAQQLEQQAEQKAATGQKAQAAGLHKQAAEKYLEAAETRVQRLNIEYTLKALENLHKARELYAQCGNNGAVRDLEKLIFELETAYAHNLPKPPPPPAGGNNGNQGGGDNNNPNPRSGSNHGNQGGNSNNQNPNPPKPPPAPAKPPCEEGEKERKTLSEDTFELPNPDLDVQIKMTATSTRGGYGGGEKIISSFFNALASIISGARKIVVRKVPGGSVLGIPMAYFEGVMRGASKIVDKALEIQEADKKTYVDLEILIPYKKVTVRCVKLKICKNGEWVEKVVMRESESSRSKSNDLFKVTKKDAITAAKAKQIISEVVPREVKRLMENKEKYEALKKKGCK